MADRAAQSAARRIVRTFGAVFINILLIAVESLSENYSVAIDACFGLGPLDVWFSCEFQ